MKAAFGKVVITPPASIGKVEMAGYSPRAKTIAGIADDIHARAILIEDEVFAGIKRSFLMISLDFLKIPMKIVDYIKDEIKDKADFGLGPGQILVHAIHTHKAPDLTGEFYWNGGILSTIRGIMFGANRNDRYIVWFTRKIVNMVKQMRKELRPCKIAWGKVLINDDIMFNRRHPIRRSKQTLSVINFKDAATNEIFGMFVSYGMHPTTLANMTDKMSADYPGRVCYRIEEQTNHKTAAVFFTGAAGDLNPITTVGTDFEKMEYDKSYAPNLLGQKGTYEHTTKLGFILGDYALKLSKEIPHSAYYDKLQFKAYIKRFWIPFEDYQPFVYNWGNWITNKVITFVKKYILFPIAMAHPENGEPNFPGLAVKAMPFSLKRGYHINVYTLVHFVSMNFVDQSGKNPPKDLTLFGFPGELFEDVEKKMLQKSPSGPDNTIIIQNANDWCAYLYPLKEYITKAGYEPLASTTPLAGWYVEKEMNLLMKEIEKGVQLGYW